MYIDLRSDTVTKPTQRMREAMANAEVGDDVYGEDPTVRKLEEYAADLAGHEAALYATSGTMGNIVSLLTHCKRGDGAIVGRRSHIYTHEGGGMATLGGVVPLVVSDDDGIPARDDIKAACRPENIHFAPAVLLCLENTHNNCGGVAVSVENFAEAVSAAREKGLAVHLDGARLFNAAVAWDVEIKAYSSIVDSVQLCLSKGLGAPMGSLICASKSFIHEARKWRKRVGGGLRQAGVVAAAGLVALQEMRLRIREDHEKASLLAKTLEDGGLYVEPVIRRTNMVFLGLPEDGLSADELSRRCKVRGVLFNASSEKRARLVTHYDVSFEDVDKAARIILEEAFR